MMRTLAFRMFVLVVALLIGTAGTPAIPHVSLFASTVAAATRPQVRDADPIPTFFIDTASPLRLMPTVGDAVQAAAVQATADYTYDPTSTYDQKGTSAPRGFSAQAPAELIDPYSGNLILRHVDLSLPGVAGLDLVLQRVYNSKIHRNYAALATNDPSREANGILFVPPSALGLGWTMHLGRIIGGVSSAPNETLDGPRYYEAPDGSQHPFFTYAGAGCGDGSNAICLVTKGFDNPYQLEANGPWYLATADGLNMTFAHTAFDGSTIVHYATEIRDVHGNRIQIRYHDNTIPGISVQREYFRHFIDSITDSAGRTINFGYSVVNQPDVVRLTSISAAGHIYRYSYTSSTPWAPLYAFLAVAQPPAGAPWRYSYAGLSNGDCAANDRRWCELTGITYPGGATITYTFNDLVFYAQNNPMAVRAVTQRVIGGRGIDQATWTYTYNRGANYSGSEHTVITRPDSSQEIYTYFGIGNGPYNPLGLAWKAGVLLQKRIRQGGNILQTETFDWIASPAISEESTGDPWIGFDDGVYLPRLQTHTIQRGNLTWTTTHTTYNENNNTPRCTTEQGPDGASRYRLSTYHTMFTQQGDYLFAFAGLPMLSGLSYDAFSATLCNPQQASSWTPALGDEVSAHEYNGEGQVTTRTINGIITDYQYHADGNLKAEIRYQGANRSDGYCTTFSDYQYGVPRTTTYGAAAPACSGGLYSTQRTLNADGSVQVETDGRDNSTGFLYDGLGRLTQITPPDQTPITIIYDGSSTTFNTTRRVEQGAYWIEYHFDGFGRPLAQESSAGIHLRQVYDALDRVIFRSLPSTNADSDIGDTFTYDALGRTRTVTHSDGTTVSYTYGTEAYTLAITDEAGRTTVHTRRSFAHPDQFWLVRVQAPGEAEPVTDTYTYLVGGHLTGVNHAGRQRTIAYNFAKQVRHVHHPETGDTFYGYDAAGNLRCRHWTGLCNDANYTHPANDVRYTVDALARVTQIQFASGKSVTLTYDNADNIVTMSDAAGTHEFEYTESNQLQKRTSTIEGVTYVTSYTYDGRGNITSITYPSGRVVTYTPDAGNRISAIPGYINNIEYHPNGLIRRMSYANGINTTLTLDNRQRPDSLAAGTLLGLNYDFDAVGNLERMVDTVTPNNTTDFEYDALDRLIDASGAWGSLHYEYNQAGDRIVETLNGQSTTYTYADGRLNNLSGRIELTYGYDHRGNVRNRGNYTYQYDEENRLISVSNADGFTNYVYDGFGHKMIAQREGCQNSRVYLYDEAGTRIAEYTLEGALLKEYINLEERPIAHFAYDPGSASPTEIDFGDVEIFTTVTRTVTIHNAASTAVTLSEVDLTFPFELAVEQPVVIAANSSVEVPVTFHPVQRGEVTRQVEACASSGLRMALSLRGRGVAAQAALTPLEIDLGDVPYGSVVNRTITVSSTGDIPLQITGWTTATGLSVSPVGSVTVPAGQTQTYTIRFDSTLTCGGPFEGLLFLVSNSSGSVRLTVKANVLALAVDVQEMGFGPLATGESRTLNVTLRNHALVPLTPQLRFDGAPQFSAGALPTTSLEPGESVQIPITYRAGAKPWSPFGDHAMLHTGFAECLLVCEASAHLIGNVSPETVPGGGLTPALAFTGDTVHVASVITRSLHYSVRNGAGTWTQGPDPTGGAFGISTPALVAGPDDKVTVLWEQAGAPFEVKLRQRENQGNWGPLCTREGFRRGWGSLAVDETGNVWLSVLDRTSYALTASPIFSAAGACQAEEPPRISQPGISWDNMNLASGPSGQMGLAVTQAERLRFLQLDLAANSAVIETPSNSEVGFGSTAAIAADSEGGWHLVWPEIFIGVGYTAPARYVYRDPVQGWGQPVTLMADSRGADSLRVAVDANGGVHVAWSDLACAPPHPTGERRKLYYATKPSFSEKWQVSDVSTPGYEAFANDLAMVLDGDRLAAVWNGYDADGDTVLLFGQSEVGLQAVSATVTPGQGGSLTSPDGDFEAQFPPGAVNEETEISYTRQAQPGEATGNLQFAGHAFTLVARSASGPVTEFASAFTLVLRYDDSDWQDAGLAREEDLNLYFWDGEAWQPILPCTGCTLDTESNTLSVQLDHLTAFALLGSATGREVYLPEIGRQ